MRWRRIIISLLLLSAVLSVLFIALVSQAYQDWAFICENTGSRKGYRQWRFGLKTTKWYKKSPLEEFMESNDPNALVHRWTCYGGDRKEYLWQVYALGARKSGSCLYVGAGDSQTLDSAKRCKNNPRALRFVSLRRPRENSEKNNRDF